jgi:hypothetical protein
MAGVKEIFDQRYVVVLINYHLETSAGQIFVVSLELPKWFCVYGYAATKNAKRWLRQNRY